MATKKRKILTEEHRRKTGLANRGKVRNLDVKKRISKTLKTKYSQGLKAGFQKGHPCYSYNLREWIREHGSPRKGKGRNPENWRHVEKIKIWREAVFKRDNWTCVLCGARSKKGKRIILHADHIKPFCNYSAYRYDVDNGRTLCAPCHRKTDTYGGKAKKWRPLHAEYFG